MAQFQNMIITRAGLDMIAQSQAGGTLIFTKGKLGDGQIGDQSIPDLTDLINAKMSVELSSVTAKTEGHVEVRFIVDNTDLDVGFFVREVGIFAKVNEEGVEQLYGYANAGNYTNYLADKSVPIDSIITKIDLVIGNASNVAFTTDKSIVYVTLEDMENALNTHDAGADAHEPAFDAHNAADDAHKDFTGATAEAAGKRGMVPAPAAGENNKFLRGDGTWHPVVQSVNGVTADNDGNINIGGIVQIESNTNLNNVITRGEYFVNGTVVGSITNAPTTKAFFLDVKEYGSVIIQLAYEYGGQSNLNPKIYERAMYNYGSSMGVWTDWHYILQSDTDHIIETYRNGNNWYRIYASGWIEQGGSLTSTSGSSGAKTVTLLKTMANTNYSLLVTDNGDNTADETTSAERTSTTQITIHTDVVPYNVGWRVEGMGAS